MEKTKKGKPTLILDMEANLKRTIDWMVIHHQGREINNTVSSRLLMFHYLLSQLGKAG